MKTHKPFKRIIWLFVKIAISITAVVWFASTVNWQEVLSALKQVDYVVLTVAFFVFLLRMLPCSLRWVHVGKTSGYHMTLWEALHGYMAGGFFNTFLPSGRGGDAARAIIIARYKKCSLGGLMGTILLERFAGLIITVAIALAASFIASAHIEALRNALPGMLVLTLLLVAAGIVLLTPFFRSLFLKITDKMPFQKVWKAVDDMLVVFQGYRKRPGALSGVAIYSLLNQIVFITAGYLAARSIAGFEAPWYSFAIVVPLVFIAELIPSIGGYGIREASFVVFFGWFGVQPESAVVYGILQLIFMWVSALIGVVFFVAGLPGSKSSVDDIQHVENKELELETNEYK